MLFFILVLFTFFLKKCPHFSFLNFFSKPRDMKDVLHMLPTKKSLEETQNLITEHIEKKINEIEELGLHDSQFWEDVDGKK